MRVPRRWRMGIIAPGDQRSESRWRDHAASTVAWVLNIGRVSGAARLSKLYLRAKLRNLGGVFLRTKNFRSTEKSAEWNNSRECTVENKISYFHLTGKKKNQGVTDELPVLIVRFLLLILYFLERLLRIQLRSRRARTSLLFYRAQETERDTVYSRCGQAAASSLSLD